MTLGLFRLIALWSTVWITARSLCYRISEIPNRIGVVIVLYVVISNSENRYRRNETIKRGVGGKISQ